MNFELFDLPEKWQLTKQHPAVKPSQIDNKKLADLRENITTFLASAAKLINATAREQGKKGIRVLDVAPQNWSGILPHLDEGTVDLDTLDIDPTSKATFIQDLTTELKTDLRNRFDFAVCTEVIEHTLNPFKAVSNLSLMLKLNGILFATVPFNFRIHGPLPDCWRITEHGIRALLAEAQLEEIAILQIEDPERPLMPNQYAFIARRTGIV